MNIVVRREHIEQARRKDSHHCMIADAIKDKVGCQYILVDTQSIRFSDPETKERYVYFTPPRAQEAILRWDRGIDIQPFAFDLAAPARVVPMRSRWKGNKRVLKKARAKYEATRRSKDPMAPRLVKQQRPKVTRYREFGVRRLTKDNERQAS